MHAQRGSMATLRAVPGCTFLSQVEMGRFHLGFSGARQALSAVMLSSSESLTRAVRDGAPGASPALPAHLAPAAAGIALAAFFRLAPDLCSRGWVTPTPRRSQ